MSLKKIQVDQRQDLSEEPEKESEIIEIEGLILGFKPPSETMANFTRSSLSRIEFYSYDSSSFFETNLSTSSIKFWLD